MRQPFAASPVLTRAAAASRTCVSLTWVLYWFQDDHPSGGNKARPLSSADASGVTVESSSSSGARAVAVAGEDHFMGGDGGTGRHDGLYCVNLSSPLGRSLIYGFSRTTTDMPSL